MNRFSLSIATALLAAALCAAPAQAGRILGFSSDGVYSDPQKIFTVQSPFPGKPAVLDGIEPDNNGAGAVSFIDQTGELRDEPGGSPLGKIVYGVDEPVHGDSWRGMAVVAHGQRFYLLMTELRVEALATPDWKYDAESADWNQFLPQLVDLYQRIEFLKQ